MEIHELMHKRFDTAMALVADGKVFDRGLAVQALIVKEPQDPGVAIFDDTPWHPGHFLVTLRKGRIATISDFTRSWGQR